MVTEGCGGNIEGRLEKDGKEGQVECEIGYVDCRESRGCIVVLLFAFRIEYYETHI